MSLMLIIGAPKVDVNKAPGTDRLHVDYVRATLGYLFPNVCNISLTFITLFYVFFTVLSCTAILALDGLVRLGWVRLGYLRMVRLG